MAEKKESDERFKKFGTVSFTSLTKTNDFIDYLEKGTIAGTRCKDCGRVFFPPRADCFQCLASHMEWFEVTGSGKLVSFSKLEYGPAGFQDDVPYSIALLDYGTFKIFGRIGKDVPRCRDLCRHAHEDDREPAAQRPVELRVRESMIIGIRNRIPIIICG